MTDIANASIIGSALGDPRSASTYSGVPYYLFAELERRRLLVGCVDSYRMSRWDVLRGAVDWRRSFRDRSMKKDALWRYRPVGMEVLSRRLRRQLSVMPLHDTLLQIGVGALPPGSVELFAHVEVSVKHAIESPVFGASYGFDRHRKSEVRQAIDGESRFLDRCTKIWTNTEWTAETLYSNGIDTGRIVVHPPGVGLADPGLIERNWEQCSILFVGKDWVRKGGPALIEAFRIVRKKVPSAVLTIAGCCPEISDSDGIRIEGYIDTTSPQGQARMESLYRSATVFCMPSSWESTGIVYMEAGLWGLPCIMLSGQGRDQMFPPDVAFCLSAPDAEEIAHTIVELNRKPDLARTMGRAAHKRIIEKYTWTHVVDYLETNLFNNGSRDSS